MGKRSASFVLLAVVLCACGEDQPVTPEERFELARDKLARATTKADRFYALGDAAEQSLAFGQVEDARAHAQELLRLAPEFPRDWNFGNAIHDGSTVLGRIALKEGRIADAKKHLIEAGHSTGSPQLDSFGPNMTLAQELLALGERDVVLEYFAGCRLFWKMDDGRLDRWTEQVRAGVTPDFGVNLAY